VPWECVGQTLTIAMNSSKSCCVGFCRHLAIRLHDVGHATVTSPSRPVQSCSRTQGNPRVLHRRALSPLRHVLRRYRQAGWCSTSTVDRIDSRGVCTHLEKERRAPEEKPAAHDYLHLAASHLEFVLHLTADPVQRAPTGQRRHLLADGEQRDEMRVCLGNDEEAHVEQLCGASERQRGGNPAPLFLGSLPCTCLGGDMRCVAVLGAWQAGGHCQVDESAKLLATVSKTKQLKNRHVTFEGPTRV
jgi:hypothetical protein